LGSLVDKSLVRSTDERYRMLETIREFAAERLADAGEEDDVRGRHAEWFAAFAARGKLGVRSADAPAWMARMELEHANLRTAIAWALENRPETASLLAAAAWVLWLVRGDWAEGASRVDAVLASARPANDETMLDLLWGSAMLHIWRGDLAQAASRARDLAAWSEQRQSRRAAAILRHVEGLIAGDAGDFDRSLALHQEAVTLARHVGDDWLVGIETANVGDALLQSGRVAAAREQFEHAMALADGFRRPRMIANIAFTHLLEGNRSLARRLFEEALAEGIDRTVRAAALVGLGAAIAVDDPRRALGLIGAADRLIEDAGGTHDAFEARLRAEAMAAATTALGADKAGRAYVEGRAATRDDAPDPA
jgi:tetratricopeptide (TPR) repeat protein